MTPAFRVLQEGWLAAAEPPDDATLAAALVPAWREVRGWAERLLVERLQLERPEQVLERPSGPWRQPIPGTAWLYRTHGRSVEVTQSGNKGGIDFAFDEPAPDARRLRLFLEKQVNAGAAEPSLYGPLLGTRRRWDRAAQAALEGAQPDTAG